MNMPINSMILFRAKPINSQPHAPTGVVNIRNFFLPKIPDKAPPKGAQMIPVIHKTVAKLEASFSLSLIASSLSLLS